MSTIPPKGQPSLGPPALLYQKVGKFCKSTHHKSPLNGFILPIAPALRLYPPLTLTPPASHPSTQPPVLL
ncbi:hypothetical protein PtB15_7B493 [Puccinia triticina]|nr:hypothetical protein PtB15_7B493 [Puccinia triticina]